jgi:hypothetical protein
VADEYTWRYLQRGRVRHILAQASGIDAAAVCGTAPLFFADWYGTGSQSEYETCAGLPACRRCVAIMPAAGEWEVAA